MSQMNVIPLTRTREDGSGKREQFNPQTSVNAVYGLPKRLEYLESVAELITGQHKGANFIPQFITKKDLKDYATKTEVANAKKDANNSASTMVNSAVQNLAKKDDLKNYYTKSETDQYRSNFVIGEMVHDGDDFNYFVKAGIYRCPFYTSNVQHAPWKPNDRDAGTLVVFPTDSDSANATDKTNLIQIWYSSLGSGTILTRTNSGPVLPNWSPWIVYDASNLG